MIYGYTRWSHGRVYYDLCKHLHRHGYILDILDWQAAHHDYIAELITYYDFFMTALDGVHDLVVGYGVPYERIIAISHHEFDIRMLIEQEGIEVFDKFANYGVVSDFLYCASMTRGVRRAPMVASLGITYADFHAAISDRLATVGYASSMAVETYGVEWKRGALAEAAVSDAGLAFKVAGSTDNQISFHDMPEFYRSVERGGDKLNERSRAIAGYGSGCRRQAGDRHARRAFSAAGLPRWRHHRPRSGRQVQGLHRRNAALLQGQPDRLC